MAFSATFQSNLPEVVKTLKLWMDPQTDRPPVFGPIDTVAEMCKLQNL